MLANVSVTILIAFLGLHPGLDHGLVRYQEQGPGGDLIGKTDGEKGGCFHIDGHAPDHPQVFFELIVVLPDPSVG